MYHKQKRHQISFLAKKGKFKMCSWKLYNISTCFHIFPFLIKNGVCVVKLVTLERKLWDWCGNGQQRGHFLTFNERLEELRALTQVVINCQEILDLKGHYLLVISVQPEGHYKKDKIMWVLFLMCWKVRSWNACCYGYSILFTHSIGHILETNGWYINQ